MPKEPQLPLQLTHAETDEIRKSLATVEAHVRLAYFNDARLDNALRELAFGAAHLAARLGVDVHGVGVHGVGVHRDERDVIAPPAPVPQPPPRPVAKVNVLGMDVRSDAAEHSMLVTELGLILGAKDPGWVTAMMEAVETITAGRWEWCGYAPSPTGIGVDVYTSRVRP